MESIENSDIDTNPKEEVQTERHVSEQTVNLAHLRTIGRTVVIDTFKGLVPQGMDPYHHTVVWPS